MARDHSLWEVTERLSVDCWCYSLLLPETTTYEVTGRIFVVRCGITLVHCGHTPKLLKSDRETVYDWRLSQFLMTYFLMCLNSKNTVTGLFIWFWNKINLQLPNKCVFFYHFFTGKILSLTFPLLWFGIYFSFQTMLCSC